MAEGDERLPSAARGRRATSYDVARQAGVSQSAVSRCFAPGGSIAAATRARIMMAAADLGYRPNALAQGLISRRTNLVAVIISSLTMRHYPEVLAELSGRLTNRDMRMLLFSLEREADVDEVLEQVWRHRVDGVISAARFSDTQIAEFEAHRVPLVLYNRVGGKRQAASVACDSVAGERDLVDRLLRAGHRRFAVVAGPADSYVGEERLRAALARLTEDGINDVPVERGDYSYESGGEAFASLMTRPERCDAVVCVNDLMAIGAVDAARTDFGLRIPEDVSVVGFDGSGPATWQGYRLTTLRQPVRRMAAAAVAMLEERIADNDLPPERRLFTGGLIEGASARIG